MVFSSSVTSSKRIGPGWKHIVEGTWNGAGVTSGDISLVAYLKRIDSCAVWTVTGTGCTRWRPNYTVAGVATPGNLALIAFTAADTGGFFADGPLA